MGGGPKKIVKKITKIPKKIIKVVDKAVVEPLETIIKVEY